MKRFAAVAHLGNGTDIDNGGLVVTLCKDGVTHIFGGFDIRFTRSGRTVVGLRRNHAAYMQHVV